MTIETHPPQRPLASSSRSAVLRRCSGALVALAIAAVALPADAETAPVLTAPARLAAPAPRVASLFEVKLRLPEGRGLARLLIDMGVDQTDAAEAAKVAAGHLGEGLGGCDAKVAISRAVAGGSLRIERVTLFTQAQQTIIDRRDGKLILVDESQAVAKRPRIA